MRIYGLPHLSGIMAIWPLHTCLLCFHTSCNICIEASIPDCYNRHIDASIPDWCNSYRKWPVHPLMQPCVKERLRDCKMSNPTVFKRRWCAVLRCERGRGCKDIMGQPPLPSASQNKEENCLKTKNVYILNTRNTVREILEMYNHV
jgi:hypothetical protein